MSSTPDLDLLGAEPGADALAGVDAVVVGVRPGTDGGDPAVAGPTSALGDLAGELPGLVALLGGTGKAEEVTRVPTRGAIGAPLVVAVGLGAEPGDTGGAGETPDLAEQVRRAAGAAARTLHGHAAHVVTTLSALDLTAAIEGTLLGDYAFTDYKKAPETAPTELTRVGLVGDGDEAAVTRAAAVARAVRERPRLRQHPAQRPLPRRVRRSGRAPWPRPPGCRWRSSTSPRSPSRATAASWASAAGRHVRRGWSA